VTYVTNATSEQIKLGRRLRAHARYVLIRIWARPNLGPTHRKPDTCTQPETAAVLRHRCHLSVRP